MRLFLSRHGETGEPYQGRYIGATDLPLSSTGREQAARLATRLPATLTHCLVSPLRRARETAEIALAGRPCRLEVMDALREIDFGRWEGLSFQEIVARDQALVEEWRRDALAFRFPGGEHTLAFQQRVQAAMHGIMDLPEEEVLIICHGGVIRVMLCALLGLPFDRYLSFSIKPATLTEVEVHGQQGVLVGLNR